MRQPVWFACGDTGLLLDFSGYGTGAGRAADATEERAGLTRTARRLGRMIRSKADKGALPGLTDIVPGLCSVLFHYDPVQISAAEIKQIIALHLDQLDDPVQTAAPLWRLPVCYGGDFGPDLDEVAGKTSLTQDEVIDRHTNAILEVAIMGFLPGLGYMTGVDKALYLPRRSEPRAFVPQGSVGLAMDQTVIYPLDSPGGWNLIGRMPIPMFDQTRKPPILLSAGDRVRFYAVNRAEYDRLEAACSQGRLPLRPEPDERAG